MAENTTWTLALQLIRPTNLLLSPKLLRLTSPGCAVFRDSRQGLLTQNTGLALLGLALFFATFFYTLVRAYHFRRTDHDVVQVSHAHRLATDPFLWVNYLPKAASARRS